MLLCVIHVLTCQCIIIQTYIYNLIYTLTLERPLVYGVIQKNGILARAHLFLWSVPFFENHDLC